MASRAVRRLRLLRISLNVKFGIGLAAQFTMDFADLFAACIDRETAQGFGLFALEAQEHFLRKRIRESKRDEV